MLLSPLRYLSSKGGYFYAVCVGRKVGVFNTWEECKKQVEGYPNAKFKKFRTANEANAFANVIDSHKSFSEVIVSSGGQKIQDTVTDLVGDNALVGRNNLTHRPVVYTDGCCLSNGKCQAVAGVGVYWATDHPMNLSEPLNVDRPTNQKAEIRAVSRALESAIEMGLSCIEVRTDSMYTIKSMTEWVTRWDKTGWTGVQNVEELKKLRELCKTVDVKWVHVPGHQGVHGNEEADRLANKGAKMILTE